MNEPMSSSPASKRLFSVKQVEATRLLKAAKAAGYECARLISYPDGRLEVVGENGLTDSLDESPFEKWKGGNASKT